MPCVENVGHLMGEFTVKVKPWAVAKLEGAQLCLPTSTPPPNSHGLSEAAKRPIVSEVEPHVLIPLTLSGTGPWTLTWEWGIALKKKKPDQIVMEEHHTEVFTSNNSHIYAGKVGYYRVKSIIDGNGSPGKIGKDSPQIVQVRSCPEARFDGLAIAGGMDLCLGRAAKHPLKVWLAGDSPFDLKLVRYSTSSKGSESSKTLSFTDLQPEAVEKLVEGLNKAGKFSLISLDLAHFESVGEHLLRIESVRDSIGLERRYGDWDLGDSVLVTVHAPPSVFWSTRPDSKPFLLEGSSSPVQLEVNLKGKGPFTVQVDIFDPADPQKLADTIKKETASDSFMIDAKLPGTYHLSSVSDALCEGSIVGPADLVVRLMGPPSAKVDFRPIKSPCNGDLGGIFELDLTGNGPWKVTLSEQVQDGKPIRRTVGSDKPRLVYRWIPETSGAHSIQFLNLADSYYPGGVALAESRQLSILPLPSARLVAPIPDASGHVYTCLGSTEDIQAEVKLTGIGPWKIEGQLSRPDKSVEALTWDITVSELKYIIPKPTVSGQHRLSLVSVSDGHGCSKTLDDQSIAINVLPKIPSASFAQTQIKAREDTSERTVISVELTGNKGPWTVEYRFIGPNGKSQLNRVQLDSQNAGIPASRDGTYELVSVRDQYCPGTIGEQNIASVSFIPMPVVTFDPSNKNQSCRSPTSVVTIKASKGTGTLRIKYREQFSHDLYSLPSKKASEHQITMTPNGSVNIPVKTDRVPGYYRYALVSVSDDVFSDVDLLARGPPQTFTLQVLPDPTPRIVDQSPLMHCLGFSIKDARIQLDFAGSSIKGSAPYTISYELINEKREIIAINSATILSDGYLQLEDLKHAGMYYVRVVKATNAHGCVWEASEQERNLHVDQAVANGHALPIHVILSPTIRRVQSSAHACLGDTATFELGGTGPWTISYTLTKSDGTLKHRTETLKTPFFSVLLAEPGSLRINSIKNAKCHLDSISSLPAPIAVKGLPTAAIEAGNQWVHEDEVASFRVRLGGEPPFTFTYQRLDENTKGTTNPCIPRIIFCF